MIDLRDIKAEPYTPLQWPTEGLIPARIKYLKRLTIWGAMCAGWEVKQPSV